MLNLYRVLLFALCGTLSWWGVLPSVTVFFSFFMFIPLLLIQRDTQGVGFVKWAALAVALHNCSAIWWVGKATALGPLASVLVYVTLFTIVFWLYNRVWCKAPKPLAYTLLVSLWIATEWFYYNSEISFPWTTLGNNFGVVPWAVQWYDYSGVFGGSLWILLVNLLLFELFSKAKFSFRNFRVSSHLVIVILFIIVPLSYSLYTYNTYKLNGKEFSVALLQPNIDPYHQQFGTTTEQGAEALMLSMAKEVKGEVSYIVAPETALEDNIWRHTYNYCKPIRNIKNFLVNLQPNAQFITGAVLYESYPRDKYPEPPTITARDRDNLSYTYDVYNSALAITRSKVEDYNKGKLVIGVEMMPYYGLIKRYGEDLYLNLGETMGMFGSQVNRETFYNPYCDVNVGSAICYESIYGDFYADFVREGAQAMFIITNDGWWGNTPGYKQHLAMASLRAIETRREIGRSANTGISAFIDSRGKITQSSEWYCREVLQSTMQTNDVVTFYVENGDIIARIAAYIAALSLLFFVSYTYKKKAHLTYTDFNTKR